MCGILGVCLNINISRSEDDLMQIKLDFANLLAAAEVRGTDAAGVYIVNKDSEIVYHKAPVAGSVLADSNDLWDMLNDYVSEKTVAIIGHTRFATHGDPAINDNNHPIFDHPIIGVHNGMIRNHERLNKRFAKAAEVDSAAIMSLLRVKSKSKPMTVDTLANNLHELEGPFAIAVADTRKPNGIFMARNNNPVNFYRARNEGKLWFASTPAILADGLNIEDDRTFEMPANKCCRIDSKAVAGKLKYHSIKRGPTPAIEYDLRRNSATQTTPRVPREVRALSDYEEDFSDGASVYSAGINDPRSLGALTDAWLKPIKKKSKKIKQAKVCSKCNEIITTVYMGGIEQDCCACVTISDMMAG